jgi:hypothetical protein
MGVVIPRTDRIRAEKEIFDEVFAIVNTSNIATNKSLMEAFELSINNWIINSPDSTRMLIEEFNKDGYVNAVRWVIQKITGIMQPKLRPIDGSLRYSLEIIFAETKKDYKDSATLEEKFKSKIVELDKNGNI